MVIIQSDFIGSAGVVRPALGGPRAKMKYRFDRFEVDSDRFELKDSRGQAQSVQVRTLELLILLLSHAGKVVTKDVIRREVWGGLFTSRTAVPSQVRKLREVLDDTKKPYRVVEAVRGKGLRLLCDVSAEPTPISLLSGDDPIDLAPAGETEKLLKTLVGHQPSIAVMPFTQERQSDDLGNLALALPTDIIGELSRFQVLRVTARASSFLLKDANVPRSSVKAVLGSDYCLDGSVTREGPIYSIFTELIECESGAIVWAERFETEPRDIHALRSEIVGRTLAWIEDKVSQNEARRDNFAQPDSLTAWQAYHVGTSLIHRRKTSDVERARTYFKRSVSIDPNFSRAWAGLAHSTLFDVINRPFDTRNEAKKELMRYAGKAVDANPEDPSANLWFGRALSVMKAEEEATVWVGRALEAAPSYALAHQQMGAIHTYLKNHELAMDHASASLMLNPHGPERFSNYAALGMSNLNLGNFGQSIKWSKKAGDAPYDNLHLLLASFCAHHFSGDNNGAARLAQRIKNAIPEVTQDQIFKLESLGGAYLQMASAALAEHGIQ